MPCDLREKMPMRLVITTLILLTMAYLYVRWLEQKSLYYPLRALEATPQDIGLKYEDVFFVTADGVKLHGWYVSAENALITVLLCHGNGGNISHRLEKIQFLHSLGVNFFLFDYRGYGKSKGQPSEEGLYQDAIAAQAWIRKRQQNTKLVVFGESLGCGVAIELAGEVFFDGLILEGAFTSVSDMARVYYPWLPGFMLATKFDSLSKIVSITIPKLFLHAQNDEIVPFSQGQRLYDAAPNPKQFVPLSGGHNDAFFLCSEKLNPIVKQFVNSVGQ